MKCIHSETKKTIAEQVILAKTPWKRMKGLLGKNSLAKGEALLILPCNSVHSVGMNFPIDVIFLSKDNKIIYMIESMKPFRLSKIIWKAKKVLELSAGSIHEFAISEGDSLAFYTD